MSLTDLKRRKKAAPRKHVSAEEFIEDANNYAFGQPSVVSRNRKKRAHALKKGLNKHRTKIYKHATFSLTYQTIDLLDKLATDAKIAKSRLIRKLIIDFAEKTEAEKSQIILLTKD